MTGNENVPKGNDNLRRLAEERLRGGRSDEGRAMREMSAEDLLYELQVHQAELQAQNEELVRAKADVEEALRKYTELYDFAPVGYFTLDESIVIREVNLTGSALLGRDREKLTGRPFLLFVAMEDRNAFHEFYQGLLHSDHRRTFEVKLQEEGEPPVHVRIEGISRQWAEKRSCLVTTTDISRIKLLEQERVEHIARLERADEVKTQFIAMASHELRNPLFVVISAIDLIQAGRLGALSEKQHQTLDAAQKNAHMLQRMVEEMLDLSSMGKNDISLKREFVDIADIISDAVASFLDRFSAKGIDLKMDVEPALPLLCADRQRLMQVLDNILENALKFTEQGEIVIRATRQDGMIRLSVSDTGIGLAARHLENIFEPFFRVEPSEMGTGLGLHIVKRIVNSRGQSFTFNIRQL
ncbi:MAG: ATP-binding protein [bacterium]|nr:ATP-binding protein [bacterium]